MTKVTITPPPSPVPLPSCPIVGDYYLHKGGDLYLGAPGNSLVSLAYGNWWSHGNGFGRSRHEFTAVSKVDITFRSVEHGS